MKIIGNEGLAGHIQTNKTTLSAPADGKGFGEIFRQTLAQGAAIDPASAASASSNITSLRPMADPSAADRLEGFFDLLDTYCQKLANPRVSLKGLEASVQQLEDGRNALSRVLGALPEGDGLEEVLNQTLVTAEVEILRFRRGDYLAA